MKLGNNWPAANVVYQFDRISFGFGSWSDYAGFFSMEFCPGEQDPAFIDVLQ